MRKRPKKLPLTALRTFEAAARWLSFKDAADELCVSATTVSNQIRQLERDWGCQLFIRKTRAVILTDEGRSLSAVLTRAFDDIRSEIDTHLIHHRKSVTLAVGPIFGARWLIPRLERFRAAYPEIELVLHHGPRITGAAMMTADIAVDWGSGTWSDLECQHLMDITYSPVLSPTLLARHGPLDQPQNLSAYPVIHQQDRSEWAAWLALAGCPGLTFRQDTTITDSNVVLQAATDGQGVALGIFPFVQSDVDAGRLYKPFAIDLHPSRSFYLLSRRADRHRPEVSALYQWILSETAS